MKYDPSNILWIFLGTVAFILIGSVYADFEFENPIKPKAEASVKNEPSLKHGLVQSFRKDGSLHTEINYAFGEKHGKASIYYPSGKIMLEMEYADGKRTGVSKKYYENGALYAETPYEDDFIKGVRKTYYRSGKLKAEIPYLNSQPGIGLKEYYQSGELKDLPKLSIKQASIDGQPHLLISISDCEKARYYTGSLFNNRYLVPDPNYVNILPEKNGAAYLPLNATSQSVNIICECVTEAGHPYVTRKLYQP